MRYNSYFKKTDKTNRNLLRFTLKSQVGLE